MYFLYIPAYSIYTTQANPAPLQAPPEPSGAIAIGITPEVWASKRDSRLRQYSRGHAHRMPRRRQEENYIQESEPTYKPCKFSMSNKAQTSLSCDFDQKLQLNPQIYNSCVARKESARHDSSSPDRAIIPHLHQLPDGNRTTALPRTLSLKNQLSNLPWSLQIQVETGKCHSKTTLLKLCGQRRAWRLQQPQPHWSYQGLCPLLLGHCQTSSSEVLFTASVLAAWWIRLNWRCELKHLILTSRGRNVSPMKTLQEKN